MTKPEILPRCPPTPGDERFTVLTFNVLLPNGGDGWWVSKMYLPEVADEHRGWPHRRRRIRDLILGDSVGSGPDVIGLQETSPASFEDDFGFLGEAGYAAVQHRKSRLRPATFWREDRFALVSVFHDHRVLVTTLAPTTGESRRLHVLNVHLTAGGHPDRRLRQIHEGLDRIRRIAVDPDPAIVVCGDFNGYGPTAVRQLLATGRVDPDVREPGRPDRVISSKVRQHGFGPFVDAYTAAYAPEPPPPTLIVPRRDWMWGPDGGPSAALRACLARLYARFGSEPWDRAAVDRWLTTINGAPDRGTEHRAVNALFAATGREALSLSQLTSIYADALGSLKLWSIATDLHRCGVPIPPPDLPATAVCLDAIWHSRALVAEGVVAPTVRPTVTGLPDAIHPSDHLPLCALMGWR